MSCEVLITLYKPMSMNNGDKNMPEIDLDKFYKLLDEVIKESVKLCTKWCPDDRDWIESQGYPEKLDEDTMVTCLLRWERDTHRFRDVSRKAKNWRWDNSGGPQDVVAYCVIPDKPWYPDDRDWIEYDGNKPDLDDNAMIDVLLRVERRGKYRKSFPRRFKDWGWKQCGAPRDIVAYTIIESPDDWVTPTQEDVLVNGGELPAQYGYGDFIQEGFVVHIGNRRDVNCKYMCINGSVYTKARTLRKYTKAWKDKNVQKES